MDRYSSLGGFGSPESKATAPAQKELQLKPVRFMLWFASSAGLVVSVMSALKICSDACSEVGLYGFLGIDLGWFGVVFFGAMISSLALWQRYPWAEGGFKVLVFAAAGAELRFIWLQKYVIGSWCPLCLTVAALVYLMTIVLLTVGKLRLSMKVAAKHLTTFIFVVLLGLSGATVGVRKNADAAELNLFLGKADSRTVVYVVSDWFCPACRRTEPAIADIFTKIAGVAKVSFVDIPVHPETSNFTPYNTQFLVHEKGKYLQLREALGKLSRITKTPSPEDVAKAVAPMGVKLRPINYADVASGMTWNREVFEEYEIKATPTVVVMNEKTGKHVNLVGEKEINYQAVLKAIKEIGK